ncbi:putative hydroxypyruvate isomerase [Trichonephila clavipes]|nr:putative hydroxypyruvate isomerase [Trichonephila clavipes]
MPSLGFKPSPNGTAASITNHSTGWVSGKISGTSLKTINNTTKAGDYATFGMASRPGDEVSFIKSIEKSIFYAVATDCKKVHILAGTRRSGYHEEDLFRIYVKNLKVALEMLEKQNISAVIEPICNEVKENYFLDSFATALKAIEIIQNKNLELLLVGTFSHLIL